ncbi:MAG: hydroxyacylglutathione hydrolase [Pseudomonadota bacterium]
MLQIHPIPAFNDNYFWLIQPETQQPVVYVIDPGAAEPVFKALEAHQLSLAGILITHHHHDHIDGATKLSQTFNIPIYGPQSTNIPQITHYLSDNDNLVLVTLHAKIIALPGHTRDHIGYFIKPDRSQPLLFCGDTLFAAGCGRLFDGSIEQLFQSLQKISQLPDETLIYCAHEYTLANIAFALFIEPENDQLIARQRSAGLERERHLPTVPNPLSLEKQTNPFLRCHLPAIRQRVEQLTQQTLTTELEVFSHLRRIKDHF